MIEEFTARTFFDRIGESFSVRVDDATEFEALVVEVVELGEANPASTRAPFSVVFRAPPDALYPQRIYGLGHPELGSFELFLVPIGPDDAGMRYEAVFS